MARASAPHERAQAHLSAADPVLGRVVTAVGACGLPPAQAPDRHAFFQGLAHAIVGQQLSGKAAATIFGRVETLALAAGRPLVELLADAPEASLRGAGLSAAKAASLRDLSRRVREEQISLEALAHAPDDEVIDALVEVRGIGRWTAEMFLMFRLGRLDVLPVADLGVRRGLMRLTRKTELPEAPAMLRRAARWAPFRSIASWYLWRLAEVDEATAKRWLRA